MTARESVGWRLRRLGDDAVEVAAGLELGEKRGNQVDRVVLEHRGNRRGVEITPLLGKELEGRGAALPLPAGLRLCFADAGADHLIDETLPLLRGLALPAFTPELTHLAGGSDVFTVCRGEDVVGLMARERESLPLAAEGRVVEVGEVASAGAARSAGVGAGLSVEARGGEVDAADTARARVSHGDLSEPQRIATDSTSGGFGDPWQMPVVQGFVNLRAAPATASTGETRGADRRRPARSAALRRND
jgi:hypothetical protein